MTFARRCTAALLALLFAVQLALPACAPAARPGFGFGFPAKHSQIVTVPPVLSGVTYDTSIGNGVDATTGTANLPLRSGAHRYFVNSSTGSDANSCAAAQTASTTKATMASALGCATSGNGDQVLVAEGTTYTANIPGLDNYSGFSATYPLVFQSYDPADATNEAKYGRPHAGQRPVIGTGGVSSITGSTLTPSKYLAIRGFKFNPGNISAQSFGLLGSNALSNHYVLIENNVFAYTTLGIQQDGRNMAQGWVIRGNSIYGPWNSSGSGHQQGAYIQGVHQFTVEDNTIYHSGWKIGASRSDDPSIGGPTKFRHSIYEQDDTSGVTRRNLFIEGSATGCSCRGYVDVKDNISINDPIGYIVGEGDSYNIAQPFGIWGFLTHNIALGDADVSPAELRGNAFQAGNTRIGSRASYNLAARTRNPSSGHTNVFNTQADWGRPTYLDWHHNIEYSWAVPGSVYTISQSATGGVLGTSIPTYENNFTSENDPGQLTMASAYSLATWNGVVSASTAYHFTFNSTSSGNLYINDGVANIGCYAFSSGANDISFTTGTGTTFDLEACGAPVTGAFTSLAVKAGGTGPNLLTVDPTLGATDGSVSWSTISGSGNQNNSHHTFATTYTQDALYTALGYTGADANARYAAFIADVTENPEKHPARLITPLMMAGYNVPTPTTQDLQLSANGFVQTVPFAGFFMGTLDGSPLSSSDLPSCLTISGQRFTYDGTACGGGATFHVTETPVTGAPHTSTLTFTVAAQPTLANLTLSAPLVSGTPSSGTFTGMLARNYATTLSYLEVVDAAHGGNDLPAGFTTFWNTWTYNGTAFTPGTLTVKEWFEGATNNPRISTIAYGSAWTPAALGSALAAWYDPSDASTLFKDTAGTIPVTADGDAVARINDKSGNGHPLIQATVGSRPIYHTGSGKPYLQFDGVDDSLESSADDTLSDGTGQHFIGLSTYLDTSNTSVITSLGGVDHGTLSWAATIGGTSRVYAYDNSGSSTTHDGNSFPIATAFTTMYAITTSTEEIWVDNSSNGTAALSGTRQSNADKVNLGSNSGVNFFTAGRVYEFFIGKGAFGSTDRSSAQTYLAGKHS